MMVVVVMMVGDTDAKQHGGALDLKLRLELVVEKQLQLIKVTHNCEAFFNFTSFTATCAWLSTVTFVEIGSGFGHLATLLLWN